MSTDTNLVHGEVRYYIAGLPPQRAVQRISASLLSLKPGQVVGVDDLYTAIKAKHQDLFGTKFKYFQLWLLHQPIHREDRASLDAAAHNLHEHGVELNDDVDVSLQNLHVGTDQVAVVVFDEDLVSRAEADKISPLVEAFDKAVHIAQMAKSPSDAAKMSNFGSEQQDAPLLNGRPFHNRGPPIEIYHPAFRRFLQMIGPASEASIPPGFLSTVHDFLVASAAIYRQESDRRTILEPILNELLGIVKSSCDGPQIFFALGQRLAALLFELKNDIGFGGCCPVVLSGLRYRKYIVDPERLPLLSVSGCPVFTLAIAGPWLSVGGAFFATEPMVQQFTDMVYIGYEPLREDRLLHVAKILFALKQCCKDLADYYATLEPKTGLGAGKRLPRSPAAFFPSQTSYPCGDSSVEFAYEDILVNRSASAKLPAKAVFRAKVSANKRSIVVKFVRRYGGQAHRALHSVNLAPELLYDGTEDINAVDFGGLRMVVMAWVEGTTLDEHQGTKRTKDQLAGQLNKALKTLRRDGWVHGDFRAPNVLVSRTGDVQVIDLDWGGRNGEARYPLTLNDGIEWADGVFRGGLIMHAHDEEMVGKLVSKYLSSNITEKLPGLD